MSVVWKADLHVDNICVLALPRGARVLTVQAQHGRPCIWFLCDADEPLEERCFHIAGTGHELDPVGTYVGTFQLVDGAFVGHVFDVTERPRRSDEYLPGGRWTGDTYPGDGEGDD